MLGIQEQAGLNLDRARELRALGVSYRQIRRQLDITPAQLQHIRRALKREKASRTRLLNKRPDATDRDLPIRQTVLPLGLRETLIAAGMQTLGDISDRVADRDTAGISSLSGIGPYKARLVLALLERHELLPESGDLQAKIEQLFPELAGAEASSTDE